MQAGKNRCFLCVIQAILFFWKKKKCRNYNVATAHLLPLYLAIISMQNLFHDGDPYHAETSSLFCRAKSMDWFLYDKDLRHEGVMTSVMTELMHALTL